MSSRFRQIDRDTPFFLPPDMRQWVPDDDLAHFILEAVEAIPLEHFETNQRGTGSEQYPPRLLLALLIYCYANGIFSSRRIERATHRDLGVRFVAANTHPDHDTICTFRRRNAEAIGVAFLDVLKLARELKLLNVGTISIDGTHLAANASKYHALTYERACELDEQLQGEIAELMKQAETADSTPVDDAQSLPDELVRRKDLHAKVAAAKAQLEKRAQARAAAERAAYEAKLKARDERPGHRKGPKPKPPSSEPEPRDQLNLTDPDSRIMRKSHNSEFRQVYNAQASVDADGSGLVLAAHVANTPADSTQLAPGIANVPEELGQVERVLADSGYLNADLIEQLEADTIEPDGTVRQGLDVYVPPSRAAAGQRRPHDFRSGAPLPEKPLKDPRLLAMRAKLDTDAGRALYAKRKQTVEPVFGIIKQAMGFRQFLLRGLTKVGTEWQLICLAYNFRRLHNLQLAQT